jgi:hypothetical protein
LLFHAPVLRFMWFRELSAVVQMAVRQEEAVAVHCDSRAVVALPEFPPGKIGEKPNLTMMVILC